MSGTELAASLVSSLAWPVVVLVLVVVMHKQIKTAADALIKRFADIKSIKAAGISVELENEIKKVAADTENQIAADAELKAELGGSEKSKPNVRISGSDGFREADDSEPEAATSPTEPTEDRLGKYQRLAELDPKAAVLVGFSHLEGLLRRYHQDRFPRPGRQSFPPFPYIVNDFIESEILPPDIGRSLLQLSRIRNKLAHSHEAEISKEAADAYIEAIGNIIGYLLLSDSLAGKPKPSDDGESDKAHKYAMPGSP
ncbi:hypothetical protein [Mycobacterium sp. HM-7]